METDTVEALDSLLIAYHEWEATGTLVATGLDSYALPRDEMISFASIGAADSGLRKAFLEQLTYHQGKLGDAAHWYSPALAEDPTLLDSETGAFR
jgi:hypothetical protein